MQCQLIPTIELAKLISISLETGLPIEIDWTNRTIHILSLPKVNDKVQLSTGPTVYQDILYNVKFVDIEEGTLKS